MSELVRLGSIIFGGIVFIGVVVWFKRSTLPEWQKGLIGLAIILTGFAIRLIVRANLTEPTP